jgi:hypothetical protein
MTEDLLTPKWTPWVQRWLDKEFEDCEPPRWDAKEKIWEAKVRASFSQYRVRLYENMIKAYDAAHSHVFILYAGYVESTTTGCVILIHRQGFHIVEEAFESLAGIFLKTMEKYRNTYKPQELCAKCGEDPHRAAEWLDTEDIEDEIRNFVLSDCDSLGVHLWEELSRQGWSLRIQDWPRSWLERAVIVTENADAIIAGIALSPPKEELEEEDPDFDWWKDTIKIPEGIVLRRDDKNDG